MMIELCFDDISMHPNVSAVTEQTNLTQQLISVFNIPKHNSQMGQTFLLVYIFYHTKKLQSHCDKQGTNDDI